MRPVITSAQNPLIRNILLLLEKPKARREQDLMVIEGIREVRLAMAGGFRIEELIFCQGVGIENELESLLRAASLEVRQTEVTAQVFSRIAYRESSGGVVALARPKRLALDGIALPPVPLILILETVEKPGNLGAILRTADAAAVDAVIVCDPQTDIYNPNAIRSSIGTIFTLQVVTATSADTIQWLQDKKIKSFATALTATGFYHDADFKQPSAIVMGSEAYGLSNLWLNQSDELIKVPMRGKIDSMNVSATAAIVMFEAMRQRGFPEI